MALTQDAARLVVEFSRPQEHSDSAISSPERRAVIEQMYAEGILIDDQQYDRELDLITPWRSWGVPARYFHFATRSLRSTPLLGDAGHTSRLQMKSEMGQPPPPAVTRRTGVDYRPLPLGGRPGVDSPRFWDVLFRRRSRRNFKSDETLSLETLSDLLWGTFRITRSQTASAAENHFRPFASGGARQPLDVYVRVDRVPGLEPGGIYHYDPLRHELGHVADSTTSELLEMSAGQQWVTSSPAQLLVVGTRARTEWKYETARAYRTLLLEAGHASQAVYMVCTALGIGCTYAGLVCDELIEQALGLDPVEQLPLGMLAVGRVEERW